MVNLEDLITRLDVHIQQSDRRHEETTRTLKEFRTMIDAKVSYKNFTWILGLMIMILMAMFGWIAYQIGDLQLTVNKTGQSVSMIQGKLDPYNVEFKNN